MKVGEFVEPTTPGGDLAWPLRRAAKLFPAREAIVDGLLRLTYPEVIQRIAALGAAIEHAYQVPPGGRVGYLGVNSMPHLDAWLGVPLAGRVLVDLNFRLADAELEFIANDAGIEILLVDAERLEVARRLRDRCPALTSLILVDGSDAVDDATPYEHLLEYEPRPFAVHGERDLAAICYTGGTTGKPKGVMLSHGNLLANARHNLIATGHTPDHRWLHVPPMFHVAGIANIFSCTWSGTIQVLAPRFDARGFIDTVRREAITHTSLVPTMLAMLMDELEKEPGSEGLASLRHIQYAASPITPALQRRVLDFFPDCDVAQFYGMTEAAPTVTQLSPRSHRLGASGEEPHARRLASVGTPVIGVEVAVLSSDGEELQAGEIGELCVRGPNVMLGYWNQEETTAAALAGGWYHSGDAVYRDEDGYLFLVDRLKDMIVTGGENVYSIEVEAALAEHPDVSEVAVFGIPDPRWGEAVHAVVSLHADATVTAEDLIAHCRPLIAGYKIPRSIELRRDSLPKSGPGKILKGELREPFWAGQARRIN